MDRRLFATSAAAFTILPLRFALAQPRAAWQDDAGSLTVTCLASYRRLR